MNNAVLVGPFLGEFFWEMFRFAPYIIYLRSRKYRNDPKTKFIILTRPDRFDLYGLYSDILCPLIIEGDGEDYIQNSYRLDNYLKEDYDTYR